MKTLAIIPARMESSRFPGKPLADICGIPMIAHCYERACLANKIDDVYISTPNEEIYRWCKGKNIPCIITSPLHERATERVQESYRILDPEEKIYSKIVLIQGDEPEVMPKDINNLIESISRFNGVSNLVCRVSGDALNDQNCVKAVISSASGEIIFFSRSPIPFGSDVFYRQLGLLGFPPSLLNTFVDCPPSALEIIESIDMMRFLENGYPIKAVLGKKEILGVDLKIHIKLVEKNLKEDKYFHIYKNKYATK